MGASTVTERIHRKTLLLIPNIRYLGTLDLQGILENAIGTLLNLV